MTPTREAGFRAALDRALRAGESVLAAGGSALDSVTEALCALEDEPLSNAGRGAVLTRDGRHEMDAAVMDGRDRRAGCVAGIMGPCNPVRPARCIMERTDHVLMVGEGARRRRPAA
ncbi:isoaspartyl peptidase/L-asparaginase [uncultured Jannaschia sp.]|uniref:isoaspartyl peptidase/L-asparaginase n=1 Tax=uncultured Jannaschia sp. TaxID=293347 RepID=UPI00260345C7|nr:isoaspartyl peptidase/L-asparaginase [uncultured Jannaschia sp.]